MNTKLFWLSVVIFMAFLNCGGENNAPVINSVTADPSTTYPRDDVTLMCAAEDEDNDAITYDWSAEAGTLSATTVPSVTVWTAPDDTGHFVMEVIVEDEEGLADTGNVTVTVDPNWTSGQNLASYGIFIDEYTYSSILIAGAPSGAIVDSVSITVDITHAGPAQLDIWLESPESTQLQIWNNNYPGGTQSFSTDFFAGEDVNGYWELGIYGGGGIGTNGTLNSWSITVFWGF
jgi:subtilisin-like proprotein convertase family protein